MPCCAPRSSTTPSTRSPRSRSTWRAPASRCGSVKGAPSRTPRISAASRDGELVSSCLLPGCRPRLSGLFHVSGGGACIAVRGRRDAWLVAARAAACRRPLGPAPTNAGRGGILELLAHAIELRRVVRAEPTAGRGRPLTMTSTTTTHRPGSISRSPERTFHGCRLAGPIPGYLRRFLSDPWLEEVLLRLGGAFVCDGCGCGRCGSSW